MSTAMARLAMVLAGISLAVGCTLFSPVPLETSKGILNQLPHTIPQQATHPATLLVLSPETNPVFDTAQMAYISKPYQVDFFTRNEWSATPAQMLQPLLIRTMEDTHYFSEIFTPPYPGNYTYALRTRIEELAQDYSAEPATVLLSLRMQLIDGATGRVVASKVIALREPMQQRTAYAGIVAANHATAKALLEVATFMLEGVASCAAVKEISAASFSGCHP